MTLLNEQSEWLIVLERYGVAVLLLLIGALFLWVWGAKFIRAASADAKGRDAAHNEIRGLLAQSARLAEDAQARDKTQGEAHGRMLALMDEVAETASHAGSEVARLQDVVEGMVDRLHSRLDESTKTDARIETKLDGISRDVDKLADKISSYRRRSEG